MLLLRLAGDDGAARAAQPLALTLDARRRSRHRIVLPDGREAAWALPASVAPQAGVRLAADDGSAFVVVAAEEPVLRIAAATPRALARAAYHLGNRHVAVEVGDGWLAIQPDEVLREMLERLGDVSVTALDAPFQPEGGAYGGGHRHGHDVTFADDYALAQSAFAQRAPVPLTPASAAAHADAREYALPPACDAPARTPDAPASASGPAARA